MTKFILPYGRSRVLIDIPRENVLSILEPSFPEPISDVERAIVENLENPMGMDKLHKLVNSEDKVAIVIDDVTRPLPSKILLPPLISLLKRVGVKRDNITIIIATGTHRAITKDEARELMGDYIASNYNWVNHNCDDNDLIYVGKTSYGNRVIINRYYVEADFKIVISDITPHYYAGFGGVYKSIVPGIAGRETINFNHSMMFDERADICNIEDNPVFLDLKEGAKLVGIDFSLAVILNPKKDILKIFAGDPDTTFYKGVEFIKSFIALPIKNKADLVISSPGEYPFDINFYQAHKGLFNTEKVVRDDGRIIFIAECSDGFGNSIFYEWLSRFDSYIDVMNELKRNFILGGHKAYYVLKTVSRYSVDLYTSISSMDVKELLRMNPIKDVQRAINDYLMENRDSTVIIMPYSYETVPIIEKRYI